jgi:hypothetical protein
MPSRALVHPLAGPRLEAAPRAVAPERMDDTSRLTAARRHRVKFEGLIMASMFVLAGLGMVTASAGAGNVPLALFGMALVTFGFLLFSS